jgi:hypothetical protein
MRVIPLASASLPSRGDLSCGRLYFRFPLSLRMVSQMHTLAAFVDCSGPRRLSIHDQVANLFHFSPQQKSQPSIVASSPTPHQGVIAAAPLAA